MRFARSDFSLTSRLSPPRPAPFVFAPSHLVVTKFGPSGLAFYFVDAARKLVFLALLALGASRGLAQACAAFLLFACHALALAAMLPFNTMLLNLGERAARRARGGSRG